MGQFTDKVVVVTGGNGGNGLSVTVNLAINLFQAFVGMSER
jgi:hypothetical protein